MVIFFVSNFLSRLKWCDTGCRSGSCNHTSIILLKMRTTFYSSYLSVSLPCWLREQKLRKFNSKGFMSDKRKIENEIFNYSVIQKRQPYAIELKKRYHMVIELYLVNDRWLLAPFQITTSALQNFYRNLSPALKKLPSILRQKYKSLNPRISRITRRVCYAEEQWLNLVIRKKSS